MATQNLGQVAGLVKAAVAPTNTNLWWLDSSVAPNVLRYYDTVITDWVPFDGGAPETFTATAGQTDFTVVKNLRVDPVCFVGGVYPDILYTRISKHLLRFASPINEGTKVVIY